MLCSSIKLTDRKEIKYDPPTIQKIKSAEEQKLLMTSDYCQSYSFRWDKPKLFYNYDAPHFLSVNNLILPENARAFNTGASLEKWSKKRPRLKSTKLQKPKPPQPPPEDNFDATPPPIEQIIPPLEANDSESSKVDPDIQNLLGVVQESYYQEEEKQEEEEGATRHHRKHHRHKRKDKSSSDDSKEEKKSKRKAIKFALSKPPSPQTVQVIRVDVTSNYSMEEAEPLIAETEGVDLDISDCSKGCGLRIKSANDLKKRELEDFAGNVCKEIVIQCNKLVLCDRK